MVAVVTAGGNSAMVRLYNGGRNAEVTVDIPIGQAHSTLRHADGGLYTVDDAQMLADLLEREWARTAPDTGTTRNKVLGKTFAGIDFLATVEHGPPKWRRPKFMCRREDGGWFHAGAGWRYTCVSVGVRRTRKAAR